MTRPAGHSLVELVVVLAIGALLALLAVPGYRAYALRAHRSEATAALLQLAAAQEKHHRAHGSYAAALGSAPPEGLGLPPVTVNGRYRMSIDTADGDAWQATATATGAQADDRDCATFTLDDAGTATATGAGCWIR